MASTILQAAAIHPVCSRLSIARCEISLAPSSNSIQFNSISKANNVINLKKKCNAPNFTTQRSSLFSLRRRNGSQLYRTFALCSSPSSQSDIITVLGKGGSGKSVAAVLLANYLSTVAGKHTCLVVQSGFDRVADQTLGISIPSKLTKVGENLWVVRLETSKLLMEGVSFIKEFEKKEKIFEDGAMDSIAGEELGVLPGLDSVLSVLALEILARPAGGLMSFAEKGGGKGGGTSPALSGSLSPCPDFDVVVFDGASSEETLRLFGSPEKSRWYLRQAVSFLQKTDFGRVSLPTVERIIESGLDVMLRGSPLSLSQSSRSSSPASSQREGEGGKSKEVWTEIDGILKRAADSFSSRSKFSAVLVANSGSTEEGEPDNTSPSCVSQEVALRLWTGAIQAGIPVSCMLLSPSLQSSFSVPQSLSAPLSPSLVQTFSNLPIVALPRVKFTLGKNGSEKEEGEGMGEVRGGLRDAVQFLVNDFDVLFGGKTDKRNSESDSLAKVPQAVSVDVQSNSVSIFLPGFGKGEVKLSQWRGGRELIIECADQRRVIELPERLRGRVVGAKFDKSTLRVTMKPSRNR